MTDATELPRLAPPSPTIDVYFVSIASHAVRTEVDQWVVANDSGEIEFITIGDRWVAVHGRRSQFVEVTGTVPRQGAVARDLTLARAMMREKRDV